MPYRNLMPFLKVNLVILVVAVCGPNISYAQDVDNDAANWAGQYAGATLGVSHGMVDTSAVQSGTGYFTGDDAALLNPQGSKDINGTDFNGSLLWGMNVQDGRTVYGIEADVTIANFDEEYTSPRVNYNTSPADSFVINTKVQSDWLISIRPRYGFALDASLFTVSAGPAVTKFQYDFDFSDTWGGGQTATASSSKLALGIAAGLGFEHKLQDDWALKTDYLYYNFPNAGKAHSSIDNDSYATDGFKHDVSFQLHSIRVGVTKAF